MKTIPRKIILHNISINVKMVKDVWTAASKMGIDVSHLEEGVSGIADFENAVILIKRDMAPEARYHVYRHEVAHFIGWIIGSNFRESQIDTLASIIADLKKC